MNAEFLDNLVRFEMTTLAYIALSVLAYFLIVKFKKFRIITLVSLIVINTVYLTFFFQRIPQTEMYLDRDAIYSSKHELDKSNSLLNYYNHTKIIVKNNLNLDLSECGLSKITSNHEEITYTNASPVKILTYEFLYVCDNDYTVVAKVYNDEMLTLNYYKEGKIFIDDEHTISPEFFFNFIENSNSFVTMMETEHYANAHKIVFTSYGQSISKKMHYDDLKLIINVYELDGEEAIAIHDQTGSSFSIGRHYIYAIDKRGDEHNE